MYCRSLKVFKFVYLTLSLKNSVNQRKNGNLWFICLWLLDICHMSWGVGTSYSSLNIACVGYCTNQAKEENLAETRGWIMNKLYFQYL